MDIDHILEQLKLEHRIAVQRVADLDTVIAGLERLRRPYVAVDIPAAVPPERKQIALAPMGSRASVKVTEEVLNKMARLYGDGQSAKAIGEACGVSAATVYIYARRQGWSRPSGRPA